MEPKFRFYEIVRILADQPRIREPILNKAGAVVGMSDPDDSEKRAYGVFLKEFGLVFSIPEEALETIGRIGSRDEAFGLKEKS